MPPVLAMPMYNIYDLPPPERTRPRAIQPKKFTVFKILQLILTATNIIILHIAGCFTTKNHNDVIVSALFGMMLFFPIFVLAGPVKKENKKLIVFNVLVTVGLIGVGAMITTSCWSENPPNAPNSPAKIAEAVGEEFSISIRYTAGIFALFSGIIYFIESALMAVKLWTLRGS